MIGVAHESSKLIENRFKLQFSFVLDFDCVYLGTPLALDCEYFLSPALPTLGGGGICASY